jgi:deoxycytidylate deaminase
MLSLADLPNDIDALEALLLASERLARERDATIATQATPCRTCRPN